MTLMEAIKYDKVPDKSLKSSVANAPLPLPLPVARAIEKLGGDIALARRRRRITQLSLAERIGASLNTVKRMESGNAKVPLYFLARTLHVFGELERLAQLLDTAEDDVGLTLMNEQLPKRIRTRKVADGQGAM